MIRVCLKLLLLMALCDGRAPFYERRNTAARWFPSMSFISTMSQLTRSMSWIYRLGCVNQDRLDPTGQGNGKQTALFPHPPPYQASDVEVTAAVRLYGTIKLFTRLEPSSALIKFEHLPEAGALCNAVNQEGKFSFAHARFGVYHVKGWLENGCGRLPR